jgi:hypothetical protein
MTPADFQAAFPVFKDEDVTTVQRHLDAAASEGVFDVDRWGSRYTRGLGLLVAHRIVTENSDKVITRVDGGDVTVKMVGSVRVERDVDRLAAQAADPMQRTPFGREFAYLRRLVGLGGAVA